MDMIAYRILEQLRQDKYLPASLLAEHIHVSERTVRNRTKELAEELPQHGAALVAKPKYGYKLELVDPIKYQLWYRSLPALINGTARDRALQVLEYLLDHPEYIRMDDLCQEIYVSRNTLSADIKQVEYLLDMYHLALEKRPNHGIRIVGTEMNRRRCIADCLSWGEYGDGQQDELKKMRELADLTLDVLQNHGLRISEVSLRSLLIHIRVAVRRIRKGWLIQVTDQEKARLSEQVSNLAHQTSQSLASVLSKWCDLEMTQDEILYLAIHIGSKTSPDTSHHRDSNLVISSKIDSLVLQMLQMVYQTMGVDFRDNLELRMSLNQHLVPFDIRMTYGIPIQNPLLEQFKREYSFAYTVAASACAVLQRHYSHPIPEDEIGYIATIFALAIEKRDKPITRKNIVVVNAAGRGNVQLFIHRYKQIFGKYIQNMYSCNVYSLAGFDFGGKDIDYVFTTIPLNITVPVPVYEISMFPDTDEISRYQRMFEFEANTYLHQFYSEALFLPHIKAKNKEEVLRLMCEHAGKHREVPEDFCKAVFQREEMGQTDFGNLVAIPHPQKLMTRECFVVVGLLDKPVWWGHNDVQAVFLVSLSEKRTANVERFYECTTSFLLNGEAVKTLLAQRDFETLIRLLQREEKLPQ